MFDFFKRLFSPPASVPAHPVPALPKPAAPQPVPVPPEAKTPSSVSPWAGDAIPVPFSDIVARLPGSLAPLVLSSVTGAFPLPVKTALAQLPSGAVRIRFAELRQSAPPGTFADDASLDETLVDLPLPKILAAMNPALLARRSGQTQLEVPEEISGVFRSKDKAPARVCRARCGACCSNHSAKPSRAQAGAGRPKTAGVNCLSSSRAETSSVRAVAFRRAKTSRSGPCARAASSRWKRADGAAFGALRILA